MSDKNLPNVVPFTLPASRMRKRAADYRRRRQPLNALELLRQAMELRDASFTRVELCETLMSMSNYEQASDLLYRTLSRDDAPVDAWLLLSRCQEALGHRIAATDCLYHYLTLDPMSGTADHVRDMLSMMEADDSLHEPFRLSGLCHRALLAWKRNDRDLAHRRMERAISIAQRPARLQLTLALLYMAEGNHAAACTLLGRVLHREPEHPRALSGMCVVLYTLGRQRTALGLLEKTARVCTSPETEGMFLTAAYTMSAWGTMRRYLEAQLRRTPCRVALLHPMAALLAPTEPNRARRLWQRILRIDPADQRARIGLRNLDEGRKLLPPGEELPEMDLLEIGLNILPPLEQQEPLTPGSQARQIADWTFAQDQPSLQSSIFQMLTQLPVPGLEDYFRELLTAPGTLPSIRQKALTYLDGHGFTEPLPMLIGSRVSMAQCVHRQAGRRRFPMFLMLLLQETRYLHQSMPLAFYAAKIWQQLPPRAQAQAAGENSYAYVKAMEVRYLLDTHQDETALRVMRRLLVSKRRVQRVLRTIGRFYPFAKGD